MAALGSGARRTGLQQTRGTTDLAGAYAQQEEERMFVEAAQIADKLHDSGFSLWKKTGDLGMVNQFAKQAYEESPQLRLLFPQGMPTYDKFLGDTVQMSGVFGEDMEDDQGGIVKAGTPGNVTFDTTSGAIRRAAPEAGPGPRERGGRPSLADQPQIQPEGAAPVEKPTLSREQAMAEARRRGLVK